MEVSKNKIKVNLLMIHCFCVKQTLKIYWL